MRSSAQESHQHDQPLAVAVELWFGFRNPRRPSVMPADRKPFTLPARDQRRASPASSVSSIFPNLRSKPLPPGAT
eukprot:8600743-Pyramimonas_sp.AAC.1